jgi:hypothetical protein
MRQKALLLAVVVAGMMTISWNCQNRRSSTDDYVTRMREARDRIAPPGGEITLMPGERVIDIDVNCTTGDPECLVIVTRPMHRRERPRTLTVRMPYAERGQPLSLTVREVARSRR